MKKQNLDKKSLIDSLVKQYLHVELRIDLYLILLLRVTDILHGWHFLHDLYLTCVVIFFFILIEIGITAPCRVTHLFLLLLFSHLN